MGLFPSQQCGERYSGIFDAMPIVGLVIGCSCSERYQSARREYVEEIKQVEMELTIVMGLVYCQLDYGVL